MECVLKYNAKITVRSHNAVCAETVEADSVMELLLLGAACGERITVSASGEEAAIAIRALTDLVKSKFGETE